MALKFELSNGSQSASSYYGFAWSLLFLGPIGAVLLKDFKLAAAILTVQVFAALVIVGFDEEFLLPCVVCSIAIAAAWSLFYNEIRTLMLINDGFSIVPDSEISRAIKARFDSLPGTDRLSALNVRALGASVLVLLLVQGGYFLIGDGEFRSSGVSSSASSSGSTWAPSTTVHPEAPSTSQQQPSTSASYTRSIKSDVSGGYLNMRTGPGTNYSVITTIPAGSTGVSLGECRDPEDGKSKLQFCRAGWNGYNGWVSISGIAD